MSIELVMSSNYLILCCPLLLLPSIFPRIWVFSNESALASGGQSTGASVSASVLPMNIQDWFPLWLTDLIPLQSKRLNSLLQHHNSKASIIWCSAFFMVQLSHPYMTTGKTKTLTTQTLVSKVMSLLFNMLSRLVIVFLLRSKCLWISWLQSQSAVILEPKKIKCHCFHFFPFNLPWSDGTGCHYFSFLNVELCQLFHSPLFPKGSLVPLHLLPVEWHHLHIRGCWYFFWQSRF